jgi:hypothetical protein
MRPLYRVARATMYLLRLRLLLLRQAIKPR